MEQKQPIDLKPTVIHRGIVYSRTSDGEINRKDPLYIIEYVKDESNLETVTVFKAKATASIPIKDEIIRTQKRDYQGTTSLALLARNLRPMKNKVIRETAPPLYMDLVYEAHDTFTGNRERGFFERRQDIIQPDLSIARSKPTGVFIGFTSSVFWVPPIVDLKGAITDYYLNKALWIGELNG